MMRMIGSRSSLRHALGEDRLHGDGGVGRAAAHREVVAQHDDRAAVDPGAAHDAVGGRELGELAVVVVLGLAGDGADLVEAARSTRRSMRSRTVSRPPSCWRCTLSGPPISRAMRSRSLSSSSSRCQLMCPSLDGVAGARITRRRRRGAAPARLPATDRRPGAAARAGSRCASTSRGRLPALAASAAAMPAAWPVSQHCGISRRKVCELASQATCRPAPRMLSSSAGIRAP